MSLSIYLDTSRVPVHMMHPLNRFELMCVMTGRKSCTDGDVRDFLRDEYGSDLANEFKPEYMLSD